MKTPRCILLAILPTFLLQCTQLPKNDQETISKIPKLTIGIQVSPAMGLIMVAEDKKFFDKNGVDVELKEFTAGKFALQAFLGGSLDVAVSGEVPVALSALQGNKFMVITQVVEKTVNETRVVVRKDNTSDATTFFKSKKRKLATSFGGGPEFFTYNFLKKHGIKEDEIELISQKPEDMPAALMSGSVDGISIFDPFARIAELQLGDKAQTFTAGDIYSELYVAAVMEKLIIENPEVLTAFLKGLKDASDYMKDHPEESKAIVIQYTKLDKEVVEGIWSNFVFKPAINNLFVQYTTAEAQWAVATGKVKPDSAVPDYSKILFTQLLKDVDKSLVTP